MFGCWLHLRTMEMELKQLREENDEMMAGQRASRISKWISSTEQVRKEAGLTAPESLQTL